MQPDSELRPEGFEGFDDFFRREYPGLVRQMSAYAGGVSLGEDLAQEAMVRVLERWATVRTMEAPRLYLYRVALNLRTSWFRSLRRQSSREGPPASVGSAHAIDLMDVAIALKKIPKHERQCVFLVDVCGFPTAEVGEILGVKPATVRKRLSRARRQLRSTLEGG